MRLQGVCVGPGNSLLESQVSINKPEPAASAHRAPLQNRPRQTGREDVVRAAAAEAPACCRWEWGGGGQREACDSWGPRTPKSHKGMGDREASAPLGTTHRGARSEEGVLQSNRVASVCARGHYKPSFIRRGYGVTLSAMLWPPVEDSPKTLFSWELCFPDTDSSSRPLVLPRNQVSTPFLSLERMMALRNTPLEE